MIYLIWGLLNIGFVIYFLVICFKATKLVRQRIGLFAAIFFVLGLISLLGQPTENSFSNKTNSWNFISEDSINPNETFLLNVELEENLISEKYLGIKYGKEMQSQHNIPISAYSSISGITSGTIWKPITIKINRTDDNNKFQYFVVGVVEWNLLGLTIYTQSKRFDGTVFTKKSKSLIRGKLWLDLYGFDKSNLVPTSVSVGHSDSRLTATTS